MEKDPASPQNLYLKDTNLNFWWAFYRLDDFKKETIYVIQPTEQGQVKYHTWLIGQNYIQELKEAKSDHSKRLSRIISTHFGKSLEEILKEEKILFGYHYAISNQPKHSPLKHYHISPHKINPVTPKDIVSIYLPTEELDFPLMEKAYLQYAREVLDIPFSRIHLPEEPTGEKRKEIITHSHHLSSAFSGKKLEITLAPKVLNKLLPLKHRLPEDKIDYGFFKDGHPFVKLKDGTERPLGPPKLKTVDQPDEE